MSQRPILPYVLGIAGLVPFVGLAILTQMTLHQTGAAMNVFLLAYGAAILSFLGGTRWGAEIHRNPERPDSLTLVLAMAPPLAGWAALIIEVVMASPLAYAVLITGLILQFIWDFMAVRACTFPKWYLPLRILLTTIAVLSLLAAAVF
ncbi:DUF3429 domain-containing protein [Hyphobacterium sp.]|uniref:DUF3429 domain-containing protein n=1 Tax=Hyphobacterium sp. TaxID=2004662 RepID=UPI0037497519